MTSATGLSAGSSFLAVAQALNLIHEFSTAPLGRGANLCGWLYTSQDLPLGLVSVAVSEATVRLRTLSGSLSG
jgi:hypothetical protein